MSEWSHLPNAAHIDRVIESSNSYPEIWSAAWSAVRSAVRDAARSAARDAAWLALPAARDAAWSAALAFIAYDDAADYLAMPSDQLKVWATLSENPAAILLIPAVIAYERISELELV